MRLEPQLRHKIANILGGQEFYLCFQCGRCTSHCPVFTQYPQAFNPRRILEKVAIGHPGVLDDTAIWRCTTCYECFEHCPWGINLAEVIVALRNLAIQKNGVPKELASLWAQVQKGGYILPETERIRNLRGELGLEPLKTNGLEDVKALAKALSERHREELNANARTLPEVDGTGDHSS
ncbi:MAG: 4Fe-4S dicluster domain-containing protein [bacterium JZ-2024 1]